MVYRAGELKCDIVEGMRGGAGSVKMTHLGDELPMHMRVAADVTLEKGDEIGYHVHEKETELYYFLSGTAQVNDNGSLITMGAGDVMYTGGGAGHSVTNLADEPVRLIAVVITE